MKKTLLFLFSLMLCWSTAFATERGIKRVEIKTTSGETVGLYEESHALVIGVSDYTAGWPDLESVAKDVDAVSASLEGHGFNVERVLNPTKNELANAFGDFIDKYGYDPENRLLFYYSGHGYTQELHGRQVGYLVPSDAPDPNEDQIGFFRRSLRMTQILSWSKQIQAKHALFIFDSCFSGSVLKERALVVPQQIRAVTDKPVRQFISAGSAGQTVPADSIFRPSFIRGIQGEADLDKDGYVTGTELGLFLQKRVTSYDTGQTPQFGKIKDPLYDEGDFVFALPQAHLSKMESKPALPEKPSSGSFSLADLDAHADEEESVRKAWQQKQGEMNAAVKQVRSYNQRNVSPSLKAEAWRRFLAVFSKDNPYSSEDEDLRNEAQNQIANWKTQQEQLKAKKKRLAEAKRKAEVERKKQEELAALRQKQKAGVKWSPVMAGGEAEVLHWWTSGGEAKALQVLKDDFTKKGGTWKDMPVAGSGGDAANATLKARIIAGDPPTASQIKGPTIQEYDEVGVVAPYHIHEVATAENWDSLLSPQVANHMKCDGFTKYCAAPINIHRIDWFWANKKVLDAHELKMPTSWDEFNAAASKLQAAGIIPLAHGGQPWQDATVFEAVALGIGGNEFYKKVFVEADTNAMNSATMVKVFDQMRTLKGFTDPGSPGRDWNVATGMVMSGKAAFQIMGDWAKGEFSNAGLKPGIDYYCLSTPSNHGYIYIVDSFIFYGGMKGKSKIDGQKMLASSMMGKYFQKIFNLYKGSIPARLDVPMDEFDMCAKQSAADLNYSSMTGGLQPSFAHGMALRYAQKGAIQDVVTEHFNSSMSSNEAARRLAQAVKNR